MFAESMVQNLEINVSDTKAADDNALNFMNGSKQQLKLKVGGMGTNNINYIYSYLVEITTRLIPFYQYYFQFYKVNKKVLVLDLLTTLNIYDHQLFQNLYPKIISILNSENGNVLEKLKHNLTVSDPISNSKK